MHVRRRRLPVFSILSLVFLLPAHRAGADDADGERAGVVVEEVAQGSGGHKAGLQPGDVVVSWSRAPAPPANPDAAEGTIASPFDLAGLEIEQVHRGPVVLAGRRGEAAMSWTLPPLEPGLTVRPPLAPELLALYKEGKDLIAAKKTAEGVARWRAAAIRARDEGQGLVGAWLLAVAARALNEAKSATDADAAWEEAAREATAASRPDAAAQILWQRGTAVQNRREGKEGAEEHFSRALALDQARDPNSFAVARDLHALGQAAYSLRRDVSAAVQHLERALAIRERLAPDSIVLADTLNALGVMALQRGDLAAQETYARRALAIQERLDPDGLGMASSLNHLALVMRERGDPAGAGAYFQRAYTISERLAPDSLRVAATLTNLGIHATERGDLAAAEDYYLRAIAIAERLAPRGVELVSSINNLGAAHTNRGDLAAAEQCYQRVYRILETLAPESLQMARVLHNLGDVAVRRGDLTAAEGHHRRALAIKEKVAPDSRTVVITLNALGGIAIKRGDLDSAEETLRRALSIAQNSALESHSTAGNWLTLGDVARQRGNLPTAEEHYRRALAIAERIAPRSALEAEALHALAVHLGSDRKVEAAAFFLRALDALEGQKTRLGGTEEARVGFAARYATYYHEAVEVLIGLERPAEALHVLERSRARSLLALLAERDVLFSADIPPELARERRMADADYDRVQKKLAALDPARNEAESQELVGRLKELRRTQEDIASRLRKASPRFAALQYPEPLDLQRVRETLDPGTTFLAYSVGPETTVLFVVQPADVPGPGLKTILIPIGEKALREKVEAFRKQIQRPPADGGARALADQGAELYELLIRPAESVAAASRRLLLGPDGPLHSLPFAALVRKAALRPEYLVEWKPLHVVASATVYAELKRARREAPRTAGRLVAFGDPHHPAPAKQDPGLREVTRAFSLTLLPSTRQEVIRIARLFTGRARTYLGDEATEARAKAVERDTRYVHFACHGTLDERFPLNSALVLSVPDAPAPGGDNGLLQAWEIFDKVRVDAELVTLSACDTALGKEMGGEGLLGLTRAFHYAGARSVLATLWAVSDTSTARLMERFYTHLKAGKTRDEALQAAQLDFIRGSTSSAGRGVPVAHPFRWAALQLSGDWR